MIVVYDEYRQVKYKEKGVFSIENVCYAAVVGIIPLLNIFVILSIFIDVITDFIKRSKLKNN